LLFNDDLIEKLRTNVIVICSYLPQVDQFDYFSCKIAVISKLDIGKERKHLLALLFLLKILILGIKSWKNK